MSRRNGILCGLVLGLLALVTPASGAENEMVPPGAWVLRTGYGQDAQDSAISLDNNFRTLKHYLIPDKATREQIDGEIERTEKWWEVLLGLGLSETWTLHFETAYRRIEQNSTLTSPTGDTAAQAEVSRLETRTVEGLGQITLKALYRPLYSDRSGFVWGFGLSFPGSSPGTPYAGRSTLYVDNPFTQVFGQLHSTTYFFPARVRFDFQLLVGTSISRDLELTSGERKSVHPGNFGHLFTGVEHDLGPFFYGIGFSAEQQGDARVGGVKQGDSSQNYAYRVMLGTGNLDELEQAPIAFPYQLYLQFDQTMQGFNTPLHTTTRVLFKTYF